MKSFIVVLIFLVSVQGSAASGGPFGLGLIIGSPTGISANYLLSESNSIASALAFDDDDIHFHVDYLFRFPKSLPVDRIRLGWYGGAGLKFRDHDHDDHKKNGNWHEHHDDGEFGPRGVAGLNYDFEKFPIEVFGEVSLVMYLIDETDMDLDFGIGGRYYF